MKNTFRRCALVRFLSYILFFVVIVGLILATQQGRLFWGISYLVGFLAGAIALLSFTDKGD
jgi:polyferredoxin